MIQLFMLLIAFQWKHFVCDFPLQKDPYMFKNKGTYGHPGGIAHSLIHAVGTMYVLMAFFPLLSYTIWLSLSVLDFIIHYHIDLCKTKINDHYGWKAESSSEFWILLGVDQLLHQLTYLAIIALLV